VKFYLGTHRPNWLFHEDFRDVPLFVSHNRMRERKGVGEAVTEWALDSGGFTQLSSHPEGWPPGCEEPYIEAVRRYMQTGTLAFASQQDWMCEPWLMHGRTVRQHQEKTVANYARLKDLAPDLPWLPVLQGWKLPDYHDCLDMFTDAGFDLPSEMRVGVGSVCRRQATSEIEEIVESLAEKGLSIHGFGVKTQGLGKYADKLASADSMAWSFRARRSEPLPDCHHGKTGTGNCANCPRYALQWRAKLLAKIGVTA
jgi:hypothetical protein